MKHILTVPLKHLAGFNALARQSTETIEEELLKSIMAVCGISDDEPSTMSQNDLMELGTALTSAVSNIEDIRFKSSGITDVGIQGTTAVVYFGGG